MTKKPTVNHISIFTNNPAITLLLSTVPETFNHTIVQLARTCTSHVTIVWVPDTKTAVTTVLLTNYSQSPIALTASPLVLTPIPQKPPQTIPPRSVGATIRLPTCTTCIALFIAPSTALTVTFFLTRNIALTPAKPPQPTTQAAKPPPFSRKRTKPSNTSPPLFLPIAEQGFRGSGKPLDLI